MHFNYILNKYKIKNQFYNKFDDIIVKKYKQIIFILCVFYIDSVIGSVIVSEIVS